MAWRLSLCSCGASWAPAAPPLRAGTQVSITILVESMASRLEHLLCLVVASNTTALPSNHVGSPWNQPD
jgi:hypothetical protein